MAVSALIGAWLAGILGGVHCIVMCGGFLTAIANSGMPAAAQGRPLLSARVLARRQFPYNLGRITTYTLLGAIAGSAGALALASSSSLLPLQRALYVIANLFLLGLAIAIAGRRQGFSWLQRAGLAMFGKVLPAMRPLLLTRVVSARYAAGMIWGFVPCALTYSVLPIALFAGGTPESRVMRHSGLALPNRWLLAWWSRAQDLAEARSIRRGRAAAYVRGDRYLARWAVPSLAGIRSVSEPRGCRSRT
jgi:sulfite exporter TauE/SafE